MAIDLASLEASEEPNRKNISPEKHGLKRAQELRIAAISVTPNAPVIGTTPATTAVTGSLNISEG